MLWGSADWSLAPNTAQLTSIISSQLCTSTLGIRRMHISSILSSRWRYGLWIITCWQPKAPMTVNYSCGFERSSNANDPRINSLCISQLICDIKTVLTEVNIRTSYSLNGWVSRANAPPDTARVISKASVTANHLTDTDITQQYRYYIYIMLILFLFLIHSFPILYNILFILQNTSVQIP